MIKVVHLITLLEFGGAQGNTIHTVRHLDKNNFESQLWCGKGAYWDAEMNRLLGSEKRLRYFPHLLRQVNPFYDFLALFELTAALRKDKPDVLHTHSSKAGIIGRLAAQWSKVPLIIHTFHGFGFNEKQPWIVKWMYVLLEKWAARWADQLIFVSEANIKTALEYKIGHPSQYQLIRSGVPMESIRKKAEITNRGDILNALKIPPHHKIVTAISAFKPQKNLVDFLRTAEHVLKRKKEITFVLIGDGEQRKDLEKMAAHLQITDSIRMPGWRKDSAEILSASDIFVLTSLWEGLPRSLVEAMVMGKPAVCYKTDGVSDILGKGGGALIPQGDVELMASNIIRILSDQKEWERLSSQAKSLISNDFDIDQMVRTQEKLYLELLRH